MVWYLENYATYKPGMKCMEKWPSGWQSELAINIKHREQLSKVRPWPKLHSRKLTLGESRPRSEREGPRKRKSVSEYYFPLHTVTWLCTKRKQNFFWLLIRTAARGDNIPHAYKEAPLSIQVVQRGLEEPRLSLRLQGEHTLTWTKELSGVRHICSLITLGGRSLFGHCLQERSQEQLPLSRCHHIKKHKCWEN